MPSKRNKTPFCHRIRTRWIAGAGFVLFLFLLISPDALHSQTNPGQVSTQYLSWTGVQIKYKNEHWSGSAEFQNRIFFGPLRQDALLFPRVILLRKINSRLSAGAGMAYFLHTSPSLPEEEIEFWNSEFRPHLELNYKVHIHRLEIASRLRVEERFLETQGANSGQHEYTRTERGRIRIQFRLPLNRKIQLLASDEFFARRSPGVFLDAEENRVRMGLGLKLQKGSDLAAEYMHVYRNFNNSNPLQRHTLVLSYTLHLSPN